MPGALAARSLVLETGASQVGLRERKKARLRQQIIDTSIRLFRRHGYEATRVEDIVQILEISQPTFFRYFPSKDAVLREVGERGYACICERLRTELGLAYLVVAHDLAVVKQVSDRVAVMYLGKLCEVGPAQDLYTAPRHPYTSALLASVPSPVPGPRTGPRGRVRAPISGEVPSPLAPPSGCRFRTRCPRAQELCAAEAPRQRPVGPDHTVACHFPIDKPEAQ